MARRWSAAVPYSSIGAGNECTSGASTFTCDLGSLSQASSYNYHISCKDSNDGYQAAVKQLVDRFAACDQVPVFADNVTVNAIAVECLQQKAET